MKKVEMLLGLGFDIQDRNEEGVMAELDGVTYSIEFDALTDDDTVTDVLRIAIPISCCGDELDSVDSICPTCKEHI